MNSIRPSTTNTEPESIVVFEKKPRWTPELKRQLPDNEYRVRGVASLSPELLKHQPSTRALLIVVLEDAEATCLQFLGKLAHSIAPPRVIVVASASTFEMEWTFREFGAANVVADRVTGEEMADLCRRLSHRMPPESRNTTRQRLSQIESKGLR